MTDTTEGPVCKTCKGKKKVWIKVYAVLPFVGNLPAGGKWVTIDCPTCSGTEKEKG